MNALVRPTLARHFHRIAWLAVILTACVVVFGAFAWRDRAARRSGR